MYKDLGNRWKVWCNAGTGTYYPYSAAPKRVLDYDWDFTGRMKYVYKEGESVPDLYLEVVFEELVKRQQTISEARWYYRRHGMLRTVKCYKSRTLWAHEKDFFFKRDPIEVIVECSCNQEV